MSETRWGSTSGAWVTHHTRRFWHAGEHQEVPTNTCSLNEGDDGKLEMAEDGTRSANDER